MVTRRHAPIFASTLPRRALSAAVLSALLATPLTRAQVTPDPNAGAHRPGTDTAANGVPVVNIVAPSAAGVSHTLQNYLTYRPQWGLVYADNARSENGALMFVPAVAGMGTAAAVAAAPATLAWGQEAWVAYQAATANYSLGAATTSGAISSGVTYSLSNAIAAGIDSWKNGVPFAQSFDKKFSYMGLAGSMVIGAAGGAYQTQMFQWAGIPNTFSNWLTAEGAVIRINKTVSGLAAGQATQASIQENQKADSK